MKDDAIQAQLTALTRIVDCILKGLDVDTDVQAEWWEAMQDGHVEKIDATAKAICRHIQPAIWEKHVKPDLTE